MEEVPLNQLLFPIAFFIAIGALLDRVIELNKLERPDQSNFSVNFQQKLLHSYRRVFIEFLGGRFFSVKYLTRVSIMSIALLSILIVGRNLEYLNSLQAFPVRTSLTYALACIAINIVSDAVSLRVTRAFAYFIATGRSWFNIVVSLSSDVILTINIFVYVCGVGLAILLLFGTDRINGELSSSEIQPSIFVKKVHPETEAGYYDIWVSISADGGDHNLDPYLQNTFSTTQNSYMRIKINPTSHLPLSSIFRVNSAFTVEKVELRDGNFRNLLSVEISKDVDLKSTLDKVGSLISASASGLYEVRYIGQAREISHHNPVVTFVREGVSRVNSLEPDIFDMISGAVIDLETFPAEMIAGFNPVSFEPVCELESDGETYLLTARMVPPEISCDVIGFGLGGRVFGSGELYSTATNVESPRMPISEMLLTSLILTSLVYIVLIGSLISAIFGVFTHEAGPWARFYFFRAPFALSGFGLGSIVSICSWVW